MNSIFMTQFNFKRWCTTPFSQIWIYVINQAIIYSKFPFFSWKKILILLWLLVLFLKHKKVNIEIEEQERWKCQLLQSFQEIFTLESDHDLKHCTCGVVFLAALNQCFHFVLMQLNHSKTKRFIIQFKYID